MIMAAAGLLSGNPKASEADIIAGLDNIVVVDTPDALLVTTLDNAQTVKQIVDLLKEDGRPEATRSTGTD